MFNNRKKIYIAPGEIRKINGLEVLSKLVHDGFDYKTYPCSNCAIANQNICFDSKTKKQLHTRPACFGNDKENLSKKSLYYSKV